MSKQLCLVLSVILTATMLLAACAPAAAPVQPTTAPAATAAAPTTAAALLDGSSIKVGLVTDTGGVNDQSFNQLAWEGVQNAAKDMGFQAKFIESKQPTDYEKNIDEFATEGYNVIITVGALMGNATALKAKQYPNIKFAIVDNSYVLAAGMSKSGFVCSVSGMQIPPLERYMISFHGGATWQKAGTKTLNQYIPSFTDPTKGKETALSLIGKGCDVVFGVGGNTVNGALLAAKENNLMAIGADVDQHNTYPEVKDALISSAQKNVDVAVYNYLKTVADGSVKAGISTATLQNGGVGLAPFHDWDSKIPADLKAQIQKASDGIKDGSIKIDLPQ